MAAEDTRSSEQAPLLGPRTHDGSSSSQHDDNSTAAAGVSKPPERTNLSIVVPCFVFLLAMAPIIDLFNVAADQITERIICQQTYPDVTEPLADPRCKDPTVQSELSLVSALENTFELIPAILTVIPFGIAADRFGRRPFLSLCRFGNILAWSASALVFCFPHTLSVRWRWAAVLLNIIGGGETVFVAVSYSLVTDATPAALRSTIFYWLIAAPLIGSLLGGPLTYLAMQRGEWFTLMLSISLQIVIFICTFFIKETLHRKPAPKDDESESAPNQSVKEMLKSPFVNTALCIRTLFWANTKLCMLFIISFFGSLGKFMARLLLRQYVAKKFHLTWAEANLTNTVIYVVQLPLVLFILPALGAFLLRAKFSPTIKDVCIIRCSFVLAIFGDAMVGLANSLPLLIVALAIFAFSAGIDPTLRSLVVSAAATTGSGTAAVMSTIGLMHSFGLFISGPFMAASFRAALRLPEFWLGLPFFISSSLMLLAAIAMFSLSFRDIEEKQSEATESRDED